MVECVAKIDYLVGILYRTGRVELSGIKNEDAFLPIYTQDIPLTMYIRLVYEVDGGRRPDLAVRDVTDAFLKARIEQGYKIEEPSHQGDVMDAYSTGAVGFGPVTSQPQAYPMGAVGFAPGPAQLQAYPTGALGYAPGPAQPQLTTLPVAIPPEVEPGSSSATPNEDKMSDYDVLKLRMMFGAVIQRSGSNIAPYSEMKKTIELLTQSMVQETLFGRRLDNTSYDKFDVLVMLMQFALDEFARQADNVIFEHRRAMSAPVELPPIVYPHDDNPFRYIPGPRVFEDNLRVNMDKYPNPIKPQGQMN